MNNPLTQLALGLWAALAVFMGITQQSWETFFSLISIAAFFSLPFWGAVISRSSRKAFRFAGYGIMAVFAVGLMAGFLSIAEQAYMTKSRTYPAWLVSADIGAYTDIGTAATVCKNNLPAIVHEKDGGQVLIRCGKMTWLGSKTYLAHQGSK